MLFLSLFVLVALAYLSLKPRAVDKLLRSTLKIDKRLGKRMRKRVREAEPRLTQIVYEFSRAMRFLIEHKKTMMFAFLMSIGWWFGNVFVGYIIFLFLGYKIDFFLVLLVFTLAILVRMIPILIPGPMGLVL